MFEKQKVTYIDISQTIFITERHKIIDFFFFLSYTQRCDSADNELSSHVYISKQMKIYAPYDLVVFMQAFFFIKAYKGVLLQEIVASLSFYGV